MLNVVKERLLAMERALLTIDAIAKTGECELVQQIARIAHAAVGACPDPHIELLAELELVIGQVKVRGIMDVDARIEKREAKLPTVNEAARQQDYLIDLPLALQEVVEGKAQSRSDFLVIAIAALRRAIEAETTLIHLSQMAKLQMREGKHVEPEDDDEPDHDPTDTVTETPELPAKLNQKANPTPKEGIGDAFKRILDGET